MDIQRILQVCQLNDQEIVNIYPYGSKVYGTDNYLSDYDYVVVSNNDMDGREFRNGALNIHVYNVDAFTQSIAEHKIHALECIFLPKEKVLVSRKDFKFTLDKAKLRHEFSQKASNSWVKCKKKLEVEKDFYIGKKSLFHAFRIIMFGQQIAHSGRIVDYSCANHLHYEIFNAYRDDWEHFKVAYQQKFNEYNTEFRKLAPKE